MPSKRYPQSRQNSCRPKNHHVACPKGHAPGYLWLGLALVLVSNAACNDVRRKGRTLSSWTYDLEASEDHKRQGACEAIALFGADGAAAVPRLITLLDDNNEGIQALCEVTLSRIGRPALPALEDTLDRPEPHVRMRAASAILAIDPDHAQAGKILAKAATGVGNAEVAKYGQDAIIRIREKAVPLLLPYLSDPYLPVQLEVVKTIGRLEKDGRAAVEALVAKARKSRSDIRVEAVKALAKVGDKATLEPIFRSLLDDVDEDVADHAGVMLQFIGSRESASGNETEPSTAKPSKKGK
jgi:HEAT repeat protein